MNLKNCLWFTFPRLQHLTYDNWIWLNPNWFEAKEALEVIESSDVIMSDQIIEATELFRTTQALEIDRLMAKITSF